MSIINTLPYTIANGQAVDATPVMADLNQIVNNVNANAVASASLAASGGANLAGFSASNSASGTVARALVDRGVCVTDAPFNADPTGVADSTAAFTNAAAAGWMVYVPSGTYKTTAPISRPAGVVFVGAGRAKTIIQASGNYAIFETIGSSTNVLVGGGVQNMTLVGTWGANNANTASYGVSESWTNRSVHCDLEIYGCYVGLYGNQGLWQVTWDNITVDGAGTQQNYIGFMLDSLPTTLPSGTSNAVIANGLVAQNCAYAGFRLLNPNGSKFVNCDAESSAFGWYIGDGPVGCYPVQFCHIANCLGDSCTYNWVFKQGSNSNPVTAMELANCWTGNASTGAMDLTGCHSINISNLQSVGNATHGILLDNCEYMTLTGSQFNGNNISNTAGVGDITIQGGLYNRVTGCMSLMANSSGVSVLESSATNGNDITDNTLFQGATIIGANTVVRNNRGFRTEASGTASITSAATSVSVTHGLALTPPIQAISVTPSTGLGSASQFWVSNVTANTFNINVNVAPGVGIGFSWNAQNLVSY